MPTKTAKSSPRGAVPPNGSAVSGKRTELVPAGVVPATLTDGTDIVYEQIHRSKLKNAPYNPRQIDPVSFKRLRENIERTKGLVQPPVWNRRTGNLVAGHKRLEALDVIRGKLDYYLICIIVDWPIEKEIEQNIALNNPSLAGDYDLTALDALLGRSDIEIGNTGFDITTLELMHIDADADLPDWMLSDKELGAAEAAEELADDLEAVIDETDRAKAEAAEQQRILDLKQKKQDFKDRQDFLTHSSIFCRVIFPTNESKRLLMEHLQLDPDGEILDGMSLLKALGLSVQAAERISAETPEKIKRKQAKQAAKTS